MNKIESITKLINNLNDFYDLVRAHLADNKRMAKPAAKATRKRKPGAAKPGPKKGYKAALKSVQEPKRRGPKPGFKRAVKVVPVVAQAAE